jgi:hypothetical protein
LNEAFVPRGLVTTRRDNKLLQANKHRMNPFGRLQTAISKKEQQCPR